MAKKSRAGRREIAKAWRVWRARFCAQRFKREYYGVDPGRLRAMKRKLTISAARNAKRNSPRVGVTPDACILVDEDGAPSDDDINSPDDLDEEDESDAEPDAEPEPTPRARGVDRWAGGGR